ncbi:MAG: CHAT domain-containing protein [Elainellaceae cyanobacterium]
MRPWSNRPKAPYSKLLTFPLLPFTVLLICASPLLPLSITLPPAAAQEAPPEDRLNEADRLLQQGIQQYQVSQFREALQSWQQALEIYREPGIQAAFPQRSRQGEGVILGNLGAAYLGIGNYQQAIDFFEQRLAIAREIGDRAGEGRAIGNLGAAYLEIGNYQRAIDFSEQHLAIAREIGDSPEERLRQRAEEGGAIGNLGAAYLGIGNYQQAIDYSEQSLIIAREIGDRAGEGHTLGNLGVAYLRIGNYQQAIDYSEQHLTIAREIGDRAEEGRALGNLGAAYWSLGQYQRAIDFPEQHLTIAREIGDRAGEGRAIGNLGIAYFSLGDYQQGINFFEQRLAIAQEIGDRAGEGKALGNLGLAYFSLGDYQQGINFFEQSLAIAREIGDRAGEGTSLGNLGLAYFSLGDYQQGINFFEQRLAIAQEIGDRAGEGKALGNLGLAYFSLGDYQQGINFFEQSLAIAQEIGDRQMEGTALGNLGNAYRDMGDYQQAIDFSEQSLAIAREIGDRAGERIDLNNIGVLWEEQNQPELAIAFLKQSVNVSESIRGRIRRLDQDLQQSYTDTVADTYRRLANLLLARGDILEAQQVLELLKIQELQEYTRGRVTNLETREYELSETEKAVVDTYGSLAELGLAAEQCKDSPDCSDAEWATLNNQLDALAIEYEEAVDALEAEVQARRNQDRERLHPDKFVGAAANIIEAQPGTVLIYPVVLDDKLWILWGSEGGVANSIEVPITMQEIGDAVLRFRRLMTQCEHGRCSDVADIQAVSQELYNYLFPQQLEDELQAIRETLPDGQVPNLVFALDRVTRYIPMAALFDGEQYLIENYTVSTILSAEQTQFDNPLPQNIDRTSVLALGLSNPVPEHGFPYALVNVPTELDAIVQQTATESLGIYSGEQLLNEAFDSSAFRQLRNGQQVLHIATHGVFAPNVHDLSYLMLGTGEPMYISELESAKRHFTDLSLVVLSACQTALADTDQSGLEIASIANTFIDAQVDTVVASLWLVNDESTSLLMEEFYRNLSQGTEAAPITISQALREAQLSLIRGAAESDRATNRGIELEPISDAGSSEGRSPSQSSQTRFGHPYYWSPFIIIGNGL